MKSKFLSTVVYLGVTLATATALMAGLYVFRNAPARPVMKIDPSALPQASVSAVKISDNVYDKSIFSFAKARQAYEERVGVARDLENFLKGAKLSEKNLAAINLKFLNAGVQVDKNGHTHVLTKSDWEDQIITDLAPDAKKAELHAKLVKERLELANALSAQVTRTAVTPSSGIAEEEEEEENTNGLIRVEPKKGLTKREIRIKEREEEIRVYLAAVFREAINQTTHNGTRDTIANSYFEDTVEEYKDRTPPGDKRNLRFDR